MSSGSGTGTIVVSTGSAVSLLRQRLVEACGDYGLVQTVGTDVWADNGANQLLNDGIEWLSMNLLPPVDRVRIDATLAAAGTSVSIPGMRTLEQVIYTDSDGHRHNVHPTTEDHIRRLQNCDDDTTGTPVFICRNTRTNTATADTFAVWPPADAAYTLECYGSAYAVSLVNDADVTWWTANKPSMVIRAGTMIRERDQLQNPRRAEEIAVGLQRDLAIMRADRIVEKVDSLYGDGWIDG